MGLQARTTTASRGRMPCMAAAARGSAAARRRPLGVARPAAPCAAATSCMPSGSSHAHSASARSSGAPASRPSLRGWGS